ncbi:hypothetical protein ZWY2020_027918 [Hordeum vulgare]|nr:hypothetical protein ZWY2020_027918 [Hordeum vulgare]
MREGNGRRERDGDAEEEGVLGPFLSSSSARWSPTGRYRSGRWYWSSGDIGLDVGLVQVKQRRLASRSARHQGTGSIEGSRFPASRGCKQSSKWSCSSSMVATALVQRQNAR